MAIVVCITLVLIFIRGGYIILIQLLSNIMDIFLLSLGVFDICFYISINRDIYLYSGKPYYEITLTPTVVLTQTPT
jgi:hypothetical protein